VAPKTVFHGIVEAFFLVTEQQEVAELGGGTLELLSKGKRFDSVDDFRRYFFRLIFVVVGKLRFLRIVVAVSVAIVFFL
jgi:hypothetical protein